MIASSLETLPRSAYLSWAEVDVSAVRHNYRLLKRLAGPDVAMFSVVKADAYGHGAVPVARALEEEGTDFLCVARVEEALELRRAGIVRPLLVFAPPLAGQGEHLIGAEAAVAVSDPAHIDYAAAAARAHGKKLRVHVKVDTGMGRMGFPPEHAVAMLRKIAATPELEAEGVMSHFSSADMKPPTNTPRQISVFDSVRRAIADAGLYVRYFHTANSAGILAYPDSRFDAVRPGISLYGQYPSLEMERRVDLRPAMTLKTRVVYVKTAPAGTGLSYGHTHVTERESRIATVPLGYADGYPRHASNRTAMLVRGKRAPQVGNVCMDLILLDVTDIPGVQIGDEVLAFGVSGSNTLLAENVADAAGTIGYELTTRIGKRLPRFYS